MTEVEIWKDVVGYEGLYKVSNRGNIYSVERKGANGRKFGGMMLKPTHQSHGYLHIGLSKDGTYKKKLVHRLVLESFVPNPNGLPEVNHRDEDKKNNYVENLEWCDTRYNLNYGTARKRAAQKTSKKVRAVNVETGEVITFNSTVEAGNKGYDRVNVGLACRGVYKSSNGNLIGDGHLYRGHKWSYEEEK